MITFVVLGYDYMGYEYIRSLGLHQDGGETGGGQGWLGLWKPIPTEHKGLQRSDYLVIVPIPSSTCTAAAKYAYLQLFCKSLLCYNGFHN